MFRLHKTILVLLLLFSKLTYADTTDSCARTILDIFKRPTVITGPCVTPQGKATFESGIQFLEYSNNSHGWTAPQTKLRIGLPWRNELGLVFPNEITNSKTASGTNASQIYLKHQIYYGKNWSTGVRVIFIPKSGSKINGTAHNGVTLNGLLGYVQGRFNATAMLSYSSYSTPIASGGKQYSTISPDIALGYYANDWVELYAEIYGQFNTSPSKGPGYNGDGGLLFLITKNFEVDIEMGNRLSGQLENFNVYYGTGFSYLF